MAITLTIMAVVLGALISISFFCSTVVEYRNVVYKIQFNEIHEQFGNVTLGKNYLTWRNAYYRYWKRSEVFHFLDDDGVNRYINIYDPVLEKCTFGESREV